jgi:hypothetical protein
MKRLIVLGIDLLKRGMMMVLVSLISLVSFVSILTIAPPANAAPPLLTPEQAINEIEADLDSADRTELYEEETKVVENPKVGIEKQYEEKAGEYLKEHPEEGNVIEKVKELVTPDTQK